MAKTMTFGWLVYAVIGQDVQTLGLYQSEAEAQADANILNDMGQHKYRVQPVPFIAWGYKAEGVFSQNGPPPLRVVE